MMSLSKKDTKQSWQELLKHAIHGMVCAKTGPLIILATASATNFDINIIVLVFEGLILRATEKIGKIITRFIPRNVLFYHRHRIAHLPIVYTHGHKVTSQSEIKEIRMHLYTLTH